MTSCEEDDDFALLGDGDGDGDGDDGNDSEAAKAKRRKKKDSPYSSTLLVPAPVPVPVPVPPKKQHQPSQGGSGSGSGSGSGDVYRKDREEWSDGAIEALLDAYTHRFELLNRGNLRGRDWEDVAAAVNTTTPTSNKTVEQCKNKIDNLKKRFKVECHRLSSSSTPTSHWPWFSKLHLIVSSSSSTNNNNNNNNNNNSSSAAFSASRGGSPIPVSIPIPIPITNTDDDGSPSASASGTPAPARNSKRYALAAPAMRIFNVPRCKWKRVLLKVSGAALAGTGTDTATAPHNVDPKVIIPPLKLAHFC